LAQQRNITACVAIVGLDLAVKVLVSGTGLPPGATEDCIKKAKSVVYLPFDGTVLNFIMRPGVLYGLANAEHGLVTYSGLMPLFTATNQHVGGVGVYSAGTIGDDNAIANAAAKAVQTGQSASSLVLPSFDPYANINPAAHPYHGAGISSNNLLALCNTAMQARATNPVPAPSVCSGRDGSGTLRLVLAQDGVCTAAVDLSLQISQASFTFPFPSEALQSAYSPYLNSTANTGTRFTGQYAPSPRSVAMPGGQPLLEPRSQGVMGSIALSSGLGVGVSRADAIAVAAAVATLPSLYSGDPVCPFMSNLVVVDAYLAALFSGNVALATNYTAPTYTLTWNGPSNLIPFAGVYSGPQALARFSSTVAMYVRDISIYPGFAPATGGILTVALDCNTIVKQWQEVSVVISTGKAISRATNTVIYTVKNSLITSANIWVDTVTYAQAFCPAAALLSCAASGSPSSSPGSDGLSSSTLDDTLRSVRGFGATNLVLIIITIALILFSFRGAGQGATRRSAASSSSDTGVPYVSMS